MTAEATSNQKVNLQMSAAGKDSEHPAAHIAAPRVSAREAMERAIFLARKLNYRIAGSVSGNEERDLTVEHYPNFQGLVIAAK